MRTALETLCFEADLLAITLLPMACGLQLHVRHQWRLFNGEVAPWLGEALLRFTPLLHLSMTPTSARTNMQHQPGAVIGSDAISLTRCLGGQQASLTSSAFDTFHFAFAQVDIQQLDTPSAQHP